MTFTISPFLFFYRWYPIMKSPLFLRNQSLYFTLFCFLSLSGCTTLPNSQDIYQASVKETVNEIFHIEIKARLEQTALKKTMSEAKQTCHALNKKRLIIVNQDTVYTHGSKSQFRTGFYTANTHIKCK